MWKDIQHVNTIVCYLDTSVETNICCALDTWFGLTPGWCLWQDQIIFFDIAHAVTKFNFVLEEGFTFCVADMEDKGRKCGPWNTLCTKKLKKEVVVSARTNFKIQSSKEGERLQDGAIKDWLSSKPLALRPIEMGNLGNQQLHLNPLQNGVTLTRSNSTQSAEGIQSVGIVRKFLTQKENRGSHPIQVGL